MKLDKDTEVLQREAEHLKGMLESEGWTVAKAKLDARILDLQMIGNVTGATPQDKVTNMEARAMAVELLFNWLKADIYGFVEQQDTAKDAMHDKDEGSFIGR